MELGPFYAVKVGRVPGVYTDSSSADEQTKGYPGAQAKSFKTRMEADTFVQATVSITKRVEVKAFISEFTYKRAVFVLAKLGFLQL